MLAETRTGMRRREGREKAGRGRRDSAVPWTAAGFGSGTGAGLRGTVVLSLAGRRERRLLRCEMLALSLAMAAFR